MVQDAGKQDERARNLQEDDGEKIPAGTRRTRCLALAGAMRRHGVPEKLGLQVVIDFSEQRCDPPLSEQEVDAIVSDVWQRYQPGPDAIFDDVPAPTPKPVSRRPELTEFGFADHFVRCHGHEFRWIPELEKWCRYEHELWSRRRALSAHER